MDVSSGQFSQQDGAPDPASVAASGLQPTSAYGTLGPGSDLAQGGFTGPSINSPARRTSRAGVFVAITLGVLTAIAVSKAPGGRNARPRFKGTTSPSATAANPSKDPRQIDSMKPQNQAETLLEMAVGNSDGAAQQISSRVDRWQGKLQWTSQISNLTTAALNSNDRQVRESGIEVELAAYGLAKNSASLDYLLKCAESSDHSQKIWALWALGLMGNRGVGADRAVQVLTAHLKDPEEDSRRWAVEGLALVGSTATVPVLLETLHNDSSPSVRERAACSLAESGMLTHEQRMSAVPQLLNDTDDPALDAQTHGWAFQALHDITHQRLPNDSAAWRSWYESTQAN
jgi:hypothetical protein